MDINFKAILVLLTVIFFIALGSAVYDTFCKKGVKL